MGFVMKKLIPLLSLLCISASLHSYSQTLSDGLVAHYLFDGDANDSSGYGNHGTVSGVIPSLDRFGNPNSAYYFAGNGEHVAVADSPSLDTTTALTLSVWVNVQPGGLFQPRILHKHTFDLGLVDTSGSAQLFAHIQNYPSGGASLVTSPLPSAQWISLVVTYDQQTFSFFTNGVIAAQINTTVPIDQNDLPIGIGRNLETGTDWFSGYIDDVRIYNRALALGEVQTLYQIESVPEPTTFALLSLGLVLSVKRSPYRNRR